MAVLAAMLERPNGVAEPFVWRVLSGPSGIGKTRLAIEWLMQAQRAGWHAGVVDAGPSDRISLDGWKAAKPTALVIDEARAEWHEHLAGILARLAAAGTSSTSIRVLVVDQVMPVLRFDSARQRETSVSAQLPEIALSPLDEGG